VQVDSDGGFAWDAEWEAAFTRVAGRVFVPPILRKLVLNRNPSQVLEWASRITEWEFTHVVAAHFSGRVEVRPDVVRRAFAFLEANPALNGGGEEDVEGKEEEGEDQSTLLNAVNRFLVDYGLAEGSSGGRK
jgi:hypothetical protein